MSENHQIQYVPITDLKEWNKNPRKNDAAAERLAFIISYQGFINPIVASPDGTIRAGHTRIKAARKLGMKIVPVIYVDFGSEEKAIAYSLADNKSSEWPTYDEELLAQNIMNLREQGFDTDLTGFTEVEIDKLLPNNNAEDDFNAAVEAEKIKKPITKPGEIIQLGRHRLMCGDSTKREDVENLMNGKIADICLTDPPYSVNLENQENKPGEKTPAMKGQPYKDAKDAYILLSGFISILPSNTLIMTYAFNKHFQELARSIDESNFELVYECIWLKQHFVFVIGRNYQPQHEPILFFRKKKSKWISRIPKTQSTIFSFPRQISNPDHPSPKPSAMWSLLIKYHSKKGSIIYDPFLGSGTTIISSEKTDRICYGMEIEPLYCDVIRKRYQQYIERNAA